MIRWALRKMSLRNGWPLMVIRPSDPAIPLRLAQEALARNDADALARIPSDAEALGVTYTVAGWLAKDGRRVVDHKGQAIGALTPGDSFITSTISN